MPIDFNQLKLTTSFLAVAANATVEDILTLLPQDRSAAAFTYVVAPLDDGRYVAARWIEIEELGRVFGINQVRSTALSELYKLTTPARSQLPGRYPKLAALSPAELAALVSPVEALDRDTTTTQNARAARDQHPARRAAVVAAGQLLGLLTNETLAGGELGTSPFGPRGQVVLGINDKPATNAGRHDRGDTLETATAGSEAPAGDTSDTAGTGAERVFNYWIEQLAEDGRSSGLSNTTPLATGVVYEFKINVAAPKQDAIGTTDAQPLAALEQSLPDDVKLLDVTVVLDSADFLLYGSKDQILTIDRGGFSKNTVSFAIEARAEGSGTLTAAFFFQGQCFQLVTIELKVGGRATRSQVLFVKRASGQAISSALQRAARKEPTFSLVIIKRENGYQFLLTGAGVTRAFVPLTPQAIHQFVQDARKDLLSIVEKEHNGDFVYQSEDTFIPKEVHAETLVTLAERGTLLFQRLFSGNQGGSAMGELLRRISRERQLNIQVVAEEFVFPWALLYDGELDPVDPQGFWGFKHVIEYLPEFTLQNPVLFYPELATIKNNERLPMVFVANTNIDSELQSAQYPPVIAPQTTFFEGLDTLAVERRTTTQEFFELLKNPDAAPLIYINCHADSRGIEDGGGPFASKLRLSDGDVDIDKLDLRAPVLTSGLRNGPLIFLNACQSAELTPYIYAGLVPALLQRGARGVIGTEVNTPALFAAEFAQTLIKRFAEGNQPLGELVLELRRDYLTTKNNVMGVVYALYSSGDLVVVRS